MILVTGGLGFIGSHTARALLDLGADCVLVGRTARTLPTFLSTGEGGRAVVERADCTDPGSLAEVGRRHAITGIVHLAGAGMGPGSPLEELWTNTLGLFTVLRAAQDWGVRRMTLASTIGVYAGVASSVYREDALLPLATGHPLPAAKKTGEIISSTIVDSDVVNVRIGAIFGPLGRPASIFFGVPQLVHAAVNGFPPEGWVPPYAHAGVDMLYAPDCGRAIALLQTASVLAHRTYNVGSGHVTTNIDVADALRRVIPGADLPLAQGRGPYDPAHLDTARLRTDTTFEPAYDLDHAVTDYVTWLRSGNPR